MRTGFRCGWRKAGELARRNEQNQLLTQPSPSTAPQGENTSGLRAWIFNRNSSFSGCGERCCRAARHRRLSNSRPRPRCPCPYPTPSCAPGVLRRCALTPPLTRRCELRRRLRVSAKLRRPGKRLMGAPPLAYPPSGSEIPQCTHLRPSVYICGPCAPLVGVWY